MAVTRIKNNQITDSTITAAKIAAATLTGGLFAADLTLTSNVTINGNFSVTGASETISATNTYVNDPLVVFNNGFTGSPTYDIGILVNRNLTSYAPYGSVNAAWVWRESDKAFNALMTAETGGTTGTINNSGFANIRVGNITANSMTLSSGTLTVTNGILNSPISGSTGYFTTAQALNFSTGNAQITGGSTTGITNFSATTVQATNFSTGNAAITGAATYIGTSGTLIANIYATVGTFSTINAPGYSTSATGTSFNILFAGNLSSPNVVITGGYINSLSNLTVTTSQATNFSTGNAVISGGSISAMGSIVSTTAAHATTTTATLNASSGNISGPLFATSISTANAVITGGSLNGSPIGSVTPSTGYFTTGYIQNFSTANAVITGGSIGGGTVQAVNFSTANAVITGGSLNSTPIGGITPSTGYFTTGYIQNFSTANAQIIGGTLSGLTAIASAAITTTILNATAGNITTGSIQNFSTGNAVITGGTLSGLSAVTSVAITATTSLTAATATATTLTASTLNATAGNITTGSIQNFSTGNAVITGGSLNSTPIGATTASTGSFTTLASNGLTTVTNNTDSIGAGTGALQVTGGAYIGGNVWVNGNLYVTNVIGKTSTQITVNDPLLYLASNSAVYNYDIGMYSTFVGGPVGLPGYTGLARDTTANQWKLFSNIKNPPGGSNINWADTGLIWDSFKTGDHIIANTTAATNTTSGALQVAGGAGVQGNVYVGNLLSPSGTVSGSVGNFTNLYGTFSGTVLGTPSTANVAYFIAEQNTTTNATFYPIFGNVAGANAAPFTNTSLTYNPSTNTFTSSVIAATTATAAQLNATSGNITTLNATNFSSGNIWATGSTSGTWSTANVTLFQQLVTTNINANLSVTMTDKLTGNAIPYTSSNIAYNPYTNTLYIGAIVTNGGTIGSTGGYGNATAFSSLTATNFSSANVVITGGYINGLSNLTAITTQTNNFSSGNIWATGSTSGTWSTANVSLYDSIAATTINSVFYPQVMDKATGNVSGYSVSTFNINPSTGALSATSFNGAGALSTLSTSGITIHNGNVVAASGVASTTTTTGALVVVGGAGISGDLNLATTSTLKTGYTTINQYGIFNEPIANNQVFQNATNSLSVGLGLWAGGTSSIYSTGALTFITGTTLQSKTFPTGGISGVTIGANGNLIAASGIESTSTSTGALVVIGGVGVSSNVFLGKSVTINSSQSTGMDFIVKGKTDATLIWARPGASYDQVIIGNSATTSTLVTGAKLIVNSTDSMIVPTGTTAQRPGSTGGTDTAGMLRFNSTSNILEFFNGISWQTSAAAFTVITDKQFNGDGGTVTFTDASLSGGTTNSLIVSINGVVQIPSLAYSLTSSTITFTEAPSSGDVIDVRVLTTTTTVAAIASANGFMGLRVDNNGVYITSGTSSAVNSIVVNTAGNIIVSGSIIPSANTSYNFGNTTSWFGTYYGVSTKAIYGDLAENYQADKNYNPGTVLMFGGDYEVTLADNNTTRVAGVVSTNPAHLMNGQLDGSNVAALALTGRVPCMVIGPIAKGDMMVAAGFGYAKASATPQMGQVIGKALADFPINAKGVIEVVIGRM